jgi:2Fe-2S ferredoxin
LRWKTEDGNEISVDVNVGLNLMEAAVANDVQNVDCSGCLSCATRHVFVDEEWFVKTGEVDDVEDTCWK